jgi:hypothetical protein
MEYYTYIYTDPLQDEQPFYVGKGRNKRCYKHLSRDDDSEFARRIQEILSKGETPNITIIECSSEAIALTLERGLINLIGLKRKGGTLLNIQHGVSDPENHRVKLDPEFLRNVWNGLS